VAILAIAMPVEESLDGGGYKVNILGGNKVVQ
jgi:hypothetical protein